MTGIPNVSTLDPSSIVDALNKVINVTNANIAATLPSASPQASATYWNSSLIQHCRIDNSPSQKYALQQNWEEPSLWEYPLGTHNLMVANSSGHQEWSVCTGDPTILTNWSAGTVVLGGGVGGEASTAEHSWVLVYNNTLYLYYVDSTQENLYCATASISTPQTFTKQAQKILAGSSIPGNTSTVIGDISVFESGGTFYLFADYSPAIYGYSIALCTSPSPVAAFTVQIAPLTSLRQTIPVSGVTHDNEYSSSGSWVGLDFDGVTVVMYYHCTAYGVQTIPTDIYRATIPLSEIMTDNWTQTDLGLPILSRTANNETQQVADPFVYCPSTGGIYLFYEASNNYANSGNLLYVVQLKPGQLQWDGYKWVRSDIRSDYIRPLCEYAAFINQSMVAALQPAGAPVAPAVIGTWVLDYTVANAYVYGAVSYNSSAAQNDQIQFDVWVYPGLYRLYLVGTTGPAQGIITIMLDSEFTGAGFIGQSWNTIDTYSSSLTYNVALGGAEVQVNGYGPFHARMAWKMATKNASSSGYSLAWNSWLLVKVE